MNIFFVNEDPIIAAQELCNRHVIKQILESTQMLCTAHWQLNTGVPYTNRIKFYRATHKNHPCNIWIRQCQNNYMWLTNHALSLLQEYTYRYGKTHASQSLINYCALNLPLIKVLPNITPPPQAMPDIYKKENTIDGVVRAYRDYYRLCKLNTIKCVWTKREKPEWLNVGETK